MSRINQFTLALFVICCSAPFISAQAQTPRVSTVNITAESDKVRINAQGDVSEMRVDVRDEQGEVVFESGAISGQQLDWNMKDTQGERVSPGTYLVTVTFHNPAGKLRKRVEQVTVSEDEQASTEATSSSAPNAVQATITGSGAAGRIAKFTGSSIIGNSVITESANKIGIGTSAPTSPLHVISADANNPTITAKNNAANGIAIFGYAPSGTGVVGQSNTQRGVVGISSSGEGVKGVSSSGAGVFGESGSAEGVVGFSDNAFGVRGISNRSVGVGGRTISGFGVFGQSTSSNGVLGTSDSSTGVGGVSNRGIGVVGKSSSGVGVRGTSSQNDGVVGQSSENSHSGVVGTHSGSGIGVYGESRSGFAGYFAGKVNITGTLTKGGGSFKIDHPLDPANKYLSHSFVESPDMMNIYNGNVTLDRRGQAIVQMPSYFSALNRDFRYQLTAIGQPGPRLYIAQEITGNRFRVAGGKPGMKVSWMVTGIRHDAFADAHRIPVEEEKPEKERGTYLHPELFGQPADKGVERARQTEQRRETTGAAAQAQTRPQK